MTDLNDLSTYYPTETCYISQFDGTSHLTKAKVKIYDLTLAVQRLIFFDPSTIVNSIRREDGEAYRIIEFLSAISREYDIKIREPEKTVDIFNAIPAAPISADDEV